MSRARRRSARFLYEFVVGDDATIAVGVVAALALTAAFPNVGGGAFWIVPAVVVALLSVSVLRGGAEGHDRPRCAALLVAAAVAAALAAAAPAAAPRDDRPRQRGVGRRPGKRATRRRR